MATEQKEYDVFISYSRKDTEVANLICVALDKAGISYFIDRQGIGGGFEFPMVLAQAIVNSRLFLFLASNNSYKSKFTRNEITFAFNKKPHNSILPYVIDGSDLPLDLEFVFAGINWRNRKEHPIESVLVNDLLTLLGRKPVAKPIVVESQPQIPPIIQQIIDNMVYVKGDTFMMGASEQDSEAYDWEKPAHKVQLDSFSIGRTLVTQEQWEAVMGNNPSRFKGAMLPVECVSWDDCQTFIKKLNQMTGKNFRLPTEAEWEFAAHGGNLSKGYKFSGSNNVQEVAWLWENSGDKPLSGEWNEKMILGNNCRTHEVGLKQSNELGLYDMSGNVWEWCQDWYGNYSSYAQFNSTGPTSGSNRVCRGGGWEHTARRCRVTYRYYCAPTSKYSDLGFRLAL